MFCEFFKCELSETACANRHQADGVRFEICRSCEVGRLSRLNLEEKGELKMPEKKTCPHCGELFDPGFYRRHAGACAREHRRNHENQSTPRDNGTQTHCSGSAATLAKPLSRLSRRATVGELLRDYPGPGIGAAILAELHDTELGDLDDGLQAAIRNHLRSL